MYINEANSLPAESRSRRSERTVVVALRHTFILFELLKLDRPKCTIESRGAARKPREPKVNALLAQADLTHLSDSA